MTPQIPFFSIFWDGTVQLAFEPGTPHLLKHDAGEVLEKCFTGKPFYQGRTEQEMSAVLTGWLKGQAIRRNLWFDSVERQWRYFL